MEGCITVLQRNEINRICVYIKKEIYFKKLTHAIVEALKSKFRKVASRLKTQDKLMMLFKPEDQKPFLFRRNQSFVVCWP